MSIFIHFYLSVRVCVCVCPFITRLIVSIFFRFVLVARDVLDREKCRRGLSL